VLARVDRVRARIRSLQLAEGAFGFLAFACGSIFLATLAQGFLRFGSYGRLALLVLGSATLLATFWRYVIEPLRHEPNDKEVARYIETRLPQLGNNLINAILLAEDAESWSPALVERAIGEAALGARSVDLMEAVSTRTLHRRLLAGLAATALLAGFIVVSPGRFSSALHQILAPFDRNIAAIGSVEFQNITPQDAAWIKGEPLEIVATIKDPHGRAYDGFVEITEGSTGRVSRQALVRGSEGLDHFTFRVPQVLQPFTYRLNIGDTESATYTITLKEPALIEKIDVVYTYPEYTGLEPQSVPNNGGDIRCLQGTRVDLAIHVSAAIAGGQILFGGGDTLNCIPQEGRKTLPARFTVLKDDTYRIRFDEEGPNGAAVTYHITALPKEPPAVQFTVPRRDVEAGPGQSVKMGLKAADRYGIGEVRLLAQLESDAKPLVVQTWKQFKDPRDLMLDYAFAVDAKKYKLGQTITYWAEAQDRRTYQGGNTPRGPNVATTSKFKITVEDKKAVAQEKLQELTKLFERLRAILEMQTQARATTSTVSQQKAVAESKTIGAGLEKAQQAIRAATLAVTKEVTFDADTRPLKEALLVLASNEEASAIAKAKALSDLDAAAAAPAIEGRVKGLAADQDAIIAALRRMLDISGKLADAVKEEQKSLSSADLPPDQLNKLKNLRDKLKEFIDEQKKVIEASKDLAKRPTDDYTEADQKELKKLEAIEDKWDKFMTEQIADFQKVPDLDASNPSLVKELIEVKTDVEMAKDALSKKAMDVVVALEDLGRESAESIEENLEKWLPDTPDRAKWTQEEMTADAEIPHAELPEQMEDLVGDLLEQEEDLFEEMEDATSALGDSMDKGVGWDAMDGPISDFSAKGVTGNQLPNSNEMGGRAGEGRQGKSSGEFVEDHAEGKGGRKTPTRLSPDAFSKGEVDDKSPESPGGSTGGGKISGAGGEGLEGPVPQQVQRRMGSLAGKQAQLRNKAEGVKAALKVKNYESFALDDAIEGMRKTQRDILAGRYQSALRQKEVVVDNLKDTQMLLGGEVRVRRDSSAAVPTEVQKDVLDALEKPMPRGYEEYLKRYYERLSEGGESHASAAAAPSTK
jgi:hypothetical protein